MAKRDFISEYMGQHIPLPGYPQIIVTRSFAYHFFKDCGLSTDSREKHNCDRLIAFAHETSALLSDLDGIAPYLNQYREILTREYAA
jgi:hypothetical protein